jgi:hypothetical protein
VFTTSLLYWNFVDEKSDSESQTGSNSGTESHGSGMLPDSRVACLPLNRRISKMKKNYYKIGIIVLSMIALQACASNNYYPIARGEICRYKAISIAQSYLALTGYPVGVAVGTKGLDLHAQACIMMKGPVALVRYSDGAIGPGSWDEGFKPEYYNQLDDFIDKTTTADRSLYAEANLTATEIGR